MCVCVCLNGHWIRLRTGGMLNRFNAILSFFLCIKCWCQLVFFKFDFAFAKVVCQSLVETRVLIR